MPKNHYNNVIAWTLKNDPAAKTGDTLAGARAIFKNMGVALPNGNMETVASILATNDYMGWRACSAEEAQAAADRGTAAIAVTEDSIHILPAADDTLNSDAAVIHAVDEAIAYYAYSCATTTEPGLPGSGTNSPCPHGNYLSFTCTQPAVCNDGVGNDYGDEYHQSQTSYMNGVLNADIHRYIVIPKSVSGYANLRGCVGVAVRNNGVYEFGIVGDVGPNKDAGILNEFSVKMIRDLGFNTDGANYVSPAEIVRTYIFPETRQSSWNGTTLNSDAETVGSQYYY